jgi:hypothetical protein
MADVFPAFGHKFIDEVAAADIRTLMLAIAGRGARDVAKRAHETTGQIFRYAIAHELARRNPAADFMPKDTLAETKEENFSSVDAFVAEYVHNEFEIAHLAEQIGGDTVPGRVRSLGGALAREATSG